MVQIFFFKFVLSEYGNSLQLIYKDCKALQIGYKKADGAANMFEIFYQKNGVISYNQLLQFGKRCKVVL